MFIMFSSDEMTDCDKCGGKGVIPIDLYEWSELGFDITRSYSWMCGVCEGEGKVMPFFEVEFDAEA